MVYGSGEGSGTSSSSPSGKASSSGRARPNTSTSFRPSLGVTILPRAPTAVGWFSGFLNHALWPWYQIAVQSPLRSATAKVWPAETRDPRSSTSSVESLPSGCRPGSWISGAWSSGSVCRRTALEPCGAHGTPLLRHPVNSGL